MVVCSLKKVRIFFVISEKEIGDRFDGGTREAPGVPLNTASSQLTSPTTLDDITARGNHGH
jgi:hypothetical protein